MPDIRRAALICMFVAGAMPVSIPAQAREHAVRGTLIDATTGEPVRRARACARSATLGPACWITDSRGAFNVEVAGTHADSLSFECAPSAGGRPRDVGRVILTLPRPDTALRVVVDATGCDLRPERTITGIFTGHWESGREHSQFVPCPSTAWFIASDTAGIDEFGRSAWFILPSRAESARRAWPPPRLVRAPYRYPQYFVRWTGTITGPGQFGHFGVSGFEARPDSLLEVRTPVDGDCGATPAR